MKNRVWKLCQNLGISVLFLTSSGQGDESQPRKESEVIQQVLLKSLDIHEKKMKTFSEAYWKNLAPFMESSSSHKLLEKFSGRLHQTQGQGHLDLKVTDSEGTLASLNLNLEAKREIDMRDVVNPTGMMLSRFAMVKHGKSWMRLTGDLGEVIGSAKEGKIVITQPKFSTYTSFSPELSGESSFDFNQFLKVISEVSERALKKYSSDQDQKMDSESSKGKTYQLSYERASMKPENYDEVKYEKAKEEYKGIFHFVLNQGFPKLRTQVQENQKFLETLKLLEPVSLSGDLCHVISSVAIENEKVEPQPIFYISQKSHLLRKVEFKFAHGEPSLSERNPGDMKIEKFIGSSEDPLTVFLNYDHQNEFESAKVLYDVKVGSGDMSLSVMDKGDGKIILKTGANLTFQMDQFSGTVNWNFVGGALGTGFKQQLSARLKTQEGLIAQLNVNYEDLPVKEPFAEGVFSLENLDEMNEVPHEAFTQTWMFGVIPKLMEFQKIKGPWQTKSEVQEVEPIRPVEGS